jgi:minor extracellular serine protease Vpr
MKMELKRSRLHASIRLLTAVSLASLPLLSHAATPIQRPTSVAQSNLHLTPLSTHAGEVEVFVRLDQLSVAELNVESLKSSGALASAASQKAQAARVSTQQASVRGQLESMGARILSAQRVGANGFRVAVPAGQLTRLRSIVGVRSVGQVKYHETDHLQSVPWVGAPSVWQNLGAKGKGVKVAVIDTGIDYLHANFGGAGNPGDYAANDRAVVEPGTFPTAKVIGGYDFAGPTYNANVAGSTPTPDSDPLDFGGHGTHVAGTVAGVGVQGSIGPGVAPEASLYALKVFGDNGGSTGLTSLAIEWAMDPNGDGDMSDRVDVINMSLGSAFGDPNDPTAISANNAADIGIIVVASAGNEGPTPYVTGSPAVAASAISIAASLPGGRLYPQLTVTAPASVAGVKPAVEGAGQVTFEQTGPIVGNIVAAAPAIGCTPLTNAAAIANNIALIARGTCGFVVKYQQAQAAGARAIIVYNNTAADPIVMGGLDATVTIPGVMTTLATGQALTAAVGVTGRIEVVADPSKDNRIADFSSQGPGQMDSSFKPDMTAPGEAIISSAVGTGTGSANFSGTSMAAPHVAGAAALLRQLHPHLNHSAIKALLQNSSANANASYDTKLTRQGVGVMRVDRAAALSSYASPGGVSFGRLNPLLPIWRTEKIALTSLTNSTRTYSVTHVVNRSLPGVEVSCPSHVKVRGKQSTNVHIALKFDPRASADAGIADDGIVSQTEVDGWCVFKDGKDELRVGYIAVVDPASSVFVTPNRGLRSATVRNLGPALGWAEAFTLAKLGGEELNRTFNSIAALGFRRADPNLYGFNVLELGLATERPFTHPSNLLIDILFDTNSDGVPDGELLAIDLAYLVAGVDPGTFITAQFDATGAGFLDWEVRTWDFNDRAIILPFTFASDGGLAPEKFDYTMYVVNQNDNTEDVQSGTIDMSKEVVPDLNSFGVDAKDKIEVNMTGNGTSLWLFQNNPAAVQTGLSISR